MKFSELIGKEVYCGGLRVGKVTDIFVDGEEWKISHFEIELRKEAAFELLGAEFALQNILAISTVGPASKSITKDSGIDFQVARSQLRIYLRPSFPPK